MSIDLEVILYIAGAIITLSGAVGIIVKCLRNRITIISTNVAKAVACRTEEKLLSKIEEMNKSLQQIIAINQERDEHTRKLSLKNAASRIFEAHSHYMKRGSITSFALGTLNELFDEYEAHDGNGFGKVCMEQIRKLPIRETEDEIKVKELQHEN